MLTNKTLILVKNFFQLDSVIFYSLVSKFWSIISGPLTALLIANKFSPIIQGYYYTFATIIALQVFVELGFGTVTQQFISHEWSKLQLNKKGFIEGNLNSMSKFYSIAQLSFKWFFFGGFLLVIGLLIVGFLYFDSSNSYNVDWEIQWLSLCVLSFASIQLVPVWSILEGCNQLKKLYFFRIIQGLIVSFSTWIFIWLGFDLWVPVIISFVYILCGVIFLNFNYKLFFKQIILSKPLGETISWKKDMFPMHWKISLSWISGYLSFSLFTPILFKFQGPEIAGKFGLTWALIQTISGISGAWINTRTPQLSFLVAERRFSELNLVFQKIFHNVIKIFLSFSLVFILIMLVLPQLNINVINNFTSRLLPLNIIITFLIGQFFLVVSSLFSSYMRSFKKEPMLFLSLISAILISSSVYISGRYFSIDAIAYSYLIIMLTMLPLTIRIWINFKKNEIT